MCSRFLSQSDVNPMCSKGSQSSVSARVYVSRNALVTRSRHSSVYVSSRSDSSRASATLPSAETTSPVHRAMAPPSAAAGDASPELVTSMLRP